MSRSFLEISNSDLRVEVLVYGYVPHFFHPCFSKYFENVSIEVSLFDRTDIRINRSYIWFLRGIFSEMWTMCLGLLQLTPFSLSDLQRLNSTRGGGFETMFVKKTCGVHRRISSVHCKSWAVLFPISQQRFLC